MARNKLTDVRDQMIEAMERINSGDMTAKDGQAIASIGKVLVESAKVEVQFIKATGIEADSGFMNLKEIQQEKNQAKLEAAKDSKFNVAGATDIGHVN